MFNEERHNYIMSKLNTSERVSVSELSRDLNVSEVTIRKDLNYLENQKFLKRTHGGAILNNIHVKSEPIETKLSKNIEQKRKIARLAKDFLKDGLNIFLDAGTTIQAISTELIEFNDLNIITYDLEIAHELSKYSNISVYVLGGYVEKDTKTSMSIEGFQNISNMHADICFIGTDAFDDNFVYSTSENKAKIKNKMIENSAVSILMCDSSKYKKKGLYSFYRSSDFDYFITDEKNKELIKKFQRNLDGKLIF
ncbi:DeoR/GlpR family DNA-binding transcription regulator [uncultured Anaerococcus sp.]|uniref:DeoR/GlpR family DNA-binding transcription regulator n=1 Tax=uncultured Anaerococcus sp. TaxID=293428 RepID=UPI00262F9364|nr:DeoR/GlpR family DNA-binding transcription regulator [uncultured Anaerococcus sp.]